MRSTRVRLVMTWGLAVAWGGASLGAQVQTEVPPPVPGARAVTVERVKIHGAALEGNLEGNAVDRDAIVFLPPSYATEKSRRYPVVYALHGYSIGAEQWTGEIHVPQTIEGAFAQGAGEMIVVLPDSKTAHNGSMYSSSVTTGDFERFISHDVVAYVDSRYRTIPDRASRGLVGHSMGGYGATRIGMRHPDVFGSLYIMSPCCLAPRGSGPPNADLEKAAAGMKTPSDGEGLPFFTRAQLATAAAWSPNPKNPPLYLDLPTKDGAAQPDVLARWAANAPLAFVDQYVGNLRQYRAIAIDVGDQDGLRAGAAGLHEALDKYAVANSFDVYPGTHTSRVADRFQNHVLKFFGRNLSPAALGQVAPGESACAALRQLQVPGATLSEVTTEWFAAGSRPPQEPPWVPPLAVKLPAYCRLDATLDRRTVADGKSYGIGFALALPAEWNGRLLFQGGGGLNGSVAPPLGRTGDRDAALARGFAVVTTDTGHRGEAFDASFMADQQASLDFAYQAVGRVAVLAKQILAQHYGKPAAHAYFMGCSTGGREGMLMSQRYPATFDGIVVGAPAMRTHFSGIGDEWVATLLNRVAPLDAAGKPDGRRALSEADRKAVIDGLLASCDAADGLRDGIVADPIGCRFDPGSLVCTGEKADGCLSRAQAEALVQAFAGPKDSKGRSVYPGFLFDTGIAATQGIPGLLAGSMNPVGRPFTATEMDVDARAERAAADPQVQLTSTSSWTNLNTFSSRGGKLLFFHGVSDPWFSALDTVDYYERMARTNGGASAVNGWSRLFLVPGMGHCGGGPATLDTFDMLAAIVDWAENQKAPQAIRATGRTWPGRSRPLCPYPSHAHYKGTGDVEDAASFECR